MEEAVNPARNEEFPSLWTCPSCQLVLGTASQLATHISMVHVPPPATKSSIFGEAFKCPECPATYLDSIDSLLHHFDTSHGSRLRLFNGFAEKFERLMVRVHKKHITVIRPAYSGSIKTSVYKNLSDNYDLIRENECLLLLRDEGPPLTAQLTRLVEMASPGDSFDLDVPFSCPECAVPVSKIDEFREHMNTNHQNAYQKWRADRIEALKKEIEWRHKFKDRTAVNGKKMENESPILKSPAVVVVGKPNQDLAKVPKTSPPEDPSTKILSTLASPSTSSGVSEKLTPVTPQLLVNLGLMHHGDPRRQKRRDLAATNRNVRAKPMTAEKLLSLSCMQCGLIFENRCKYTRHLLDHKMESSPYRCPVKACMMSYDVKAKLRSHVQRKHPEIPESSIELAYAQGDTIFAPKTPTSMSVTSFLAQQNLLDSPQNFIKEELVDRCASENHAEPIDVNHLFTVETLNSGPKIKEEVDDEVFNDSTSFSRNGRKRKAPNQFSP